jgi:hypothetical protein
MPASANAAAVVEAPPVNATFEYQIGGAYAPASGVGIVDRDRHDSPAKGVYSICYVNAFQTQPEEASWWRAHHPSLLAHTAAGKPIEDPDWPGEFLLDTSTSAHRKALLAVVGRWFDGCAAKGFQAVEPDNLDSWTRSHGVLTKADNLAFATLLVARGHAHGVAVAQKNTTELGAAGKTKAHFDFAIAEECQVYSECSSYTSVYGRHVIEIEYTDNGTKYFTAACKARGAQISIILRDRDVVARGKAAYRYRSC